MPDFIFSSLLCFYRPIRISKHRSGGAYKIHLVFPKYLFRICRFSDNRNANHRYINRLFYRGRAIYFPALIKSDRLPRRIHGFINSRADIKRVNLFLFQMSGDLNSFLKMNSFLRLSFILQMLICRISDDYRKIIPAPDTDFIYNLVKKSHPVLKIAAV